LRAGSPNTSDGAAVAGTANPNRPLTELQHNFVKYWAAGETPRTALLKAGYAETSTNTLTHKYKNDPAILRAYHAAAEKYEKAASMTREKLMGKLEEAMDMAQLMADPTAMGAACREIGKICGYYETKKIEINVNHRGQIALERLSTLSNDELIKLIEAPTAIEGEYERVDTDEAGNDPPER